MSECGFRVERGSYFIGPCLLDEGHEGRHDPVPVLTDEERKRTYGMDPFVEVKVMRGILPHQCGPDCAFPEYEHLPAKPRMTQAGGLSASEVKE